MARTSRPTPRELNPNWSEGPSSDPVGEMGRLFAENVRLAVRGSSLRAAAAACGMQHATLSQILDGRLWVDTASLARLEIGLDARLWPTRAEWPEAP